MFIIFNSVVILIMIKFNENLIFFVNVNGTITNWWAFLYLTNLVALVNVPGCDMSSVLRHDKQMDTVYSKL